MLLLMGAAAYQGPCQRQQHAAQLAARHFLVARRIQTVPVLPRAPIRPPQVVVAQGVLQRASAELTIKDASAIADNTLEFSVRSVLWALGAPELLRASQGAARRLVLGASQGC
jgi:hypothetical protein